MTQLSNERIQLARVEFGIDIKITEAIKKADSMSDNGASNMTVIRTKEFAICIYNDYKMTVAQDEIIEQIYSTDNGFIYQPAA